MNLVLFIKQIKPFIGKYQYKLWGIGLLLLFPTSFFLIMPLSVQLIFDQAIAKQDMQMMWYILAGLSIAFILNIIAELWQSYLSASSSASIISDIRLHLFQHLQQLPMNFHMRTSSGELVSHFTNDLLAVERVMTTSLFKLILFGLVGILSLLLMFYIEWRLALLTFIALPLGLLGPRWFGPKATQMTAEKKQQEAIAVKALQENLQAQQVIRAFVLENSMLSKFKQHLSTLRHFSLYANLFSIIVEKCIGMSIFFGQIFIIAMGGFIAVNGDLTQGALIGFVGLLLNAAGAAMSIAGLTPEIILGMSGMQRISDVLNQPCHPQIDNPVMLPKFTHQLVFDQVAFSYGTELNLQDINFTISAGQTVAFVGASGSGKSTLLNMMTRCCQPSHGRIIIDGHDLQQIQTASYLAQLGIVFQDTILFDTSIRENIHLGNLDASDDDIKQAAIAAEIDQLIESLPQQYDTQIGEAGGRLSGGQRQRIAIARAVLRNPSILVLDEATSALDPVTETAINQTLKKFCQQRTVISITHRLASIMDYDVIFVLEQGKIVEQGNHNSLLEQAGVYKRLWHKQHGFRVNKEGDHAEVTWERLTEVPILQKLSVDKLRQIVPFFVTERFVKGKTIIAENDPADHFYIMVRGIAQVTKTNSTGQEEKVAMLLDGDHFGEIALLKDIQRTSTIIARTDCICLALDRGHFLAIIAQDDELRQRLELELIERISNLDAIG